MRGPRAAGHIVPNAAGLRDNNSVGRPTATVVPALGGVSDTARVVLRYTHELTLTSTSGAYTSNVFRGNGPFDPDQTGTGAQPVWYDDYSAMYNRYRCVGSRITVTFCHYTNSNVALVAGVTPQHQTTSMASLVFAMAQPYTTVTCNTPHNVGRTVSQALTTAKYLGYSQTGFMGSDAVQCLYSTVPSHQWYWHVFARSVDSSTTLSMAALVYLDYDIIWFDKVDGNLDYHRRLNYFSEAKRVCALPKPSSDRKDDPATQDVPPGVRSLPESKAGMSEPWSFVEDDDDEGIRAQFLAWKASLGKRATRAVSQLTAGASLLSPPGFTASASAGAPALPRSSSAKGTTTQSLAGQPGAGLKDAS